MIILQDKDCGIHEIHIEDLKTILFLGDYRFLENISYPLRISGSTLDFFLKGTIIDIPISCLIMEMKYLVELGLNYSLDPYKEIKERIIFVHNDEEKENLISLYFVLIGNNEPNYCNFISMVNGITIEEFIDRIEKLRRLHEFRNIGGYMETKSLVIIDGGGMNHLLEASVLTSQSEILFSGNNSISINASSYSVSIFIDILYKIYKGMYFYNLDYKLNENSIDSIIMELLKLLKEFKIRKDRNYQAAQFLRTWGPNE